jgi:hypothetical protein
MTQQIVQKYRVHGRVRRQDGPLSDVVVRAYDRDLRREALLGKARTDQNGEYEIAYAAEHLVRPDKDRADLVVRAFAPTGIQLAVSETLFDAPAVATLDLVVQSEPQLSEYEERLARLAPLVQDLSFSELIEGDLDFLAKKTKVPKVSIERLAAAGRYARDTGLPAEAFYGWAQQEQPLDLQTLLTIDVDRLIDALKAAIKAQIIPARLSDAFDDLERRLRDLRFEKGVVVIHQFVGRLLDQGAHKPLAGFTVRAFDLEDGPTPQPLSSDASNARGLFAIEFATNADGRHRKLRLDIVHPRGAMIYQATITAHVDQAEALDLHVPVVPAPQPPSPTLDELDTKLNMNLPRELRDFLIERGITNLAQIRSAGGISRLQGLPVAPDSAAVQALVAHASLNVLTDDVALANALIERGFTTIAAVASAPRTRVVALLGDQAGEFRAAQLHVTAQAQALLLNNVATDIRTARANGFAIPGLAEADLPDELVGETCRCRDCEAAVSPQAYLADLLDYTVSNLEDDGDPVTLNKLARLFHQPFGELPATCEERTVSQVRLAIEVLRRYLKPDDQAAADTRDYLERTYTALLSRIGTSYEELRLTRAGEPAERQALAERLGVQLQAQRPDQLDALLLIEPDAITEQSLERLFGLVDTTRDPLSGGITLGDDQGQITRWNLDGVAWDINTDENGAVHLSLTRPRPDHSVVEIFRDRARTQLLASGFRRSNKGPVDLRPENLNGLSGQVIIAYQSDTQDISLVVVPNFLSWRLQFLRAQWRRQDWPEVEPDLAYPLIDPDLIGPEDLRDTVPGAPAFDLWLSRRDALITRKDEIKTLREAAESEQAGLRRILADAGVPLARLLELAEQREQGQNIGSQLQELKLDVAAFDYLLRIRRLIRSNPSPDPIVLDSEWNDVYDILVQVFKRGHFSAWRQAEQAIDLTLGPDYFRIPAPPLTFPRPEPAPLPFWRASETARRDWQQRLQSHIEQEQSVINALQEAVRATEAETLPLLRDALLAVKDEQGLSSRLLIDFQADGCQRITRLGLAIETIQLLLWSVRTGQLADTHPNLSLPVDNFDEVWRWLGSYATWRAAMLVFMYPENVLLPSLRREQTPTFRKLVHDTRDNPRLTPEAACRSAQEYEAYLRDVTDLRLEAAVLARTETHVDDCRREAFKGSSDFIYIFARGRHTNTVYWSRYDSQADVDYAQNFWGPVPNLEDVINVVGAAVYAQPTGERAIYLFARVREAEAQRLVYTVYDLQQDRWTGQITDLELPNDVQTFTAVVKQRHEETELLHLAIRAPTTVIYDRHLNAAGTGWEERDFRFLERISERNNIIELCDLMTPAQSVSSARESFYLVGITDEGRLKIRFYQRFSDNETGIITIEVGSSVEGWVGGFPWPDSKRLYCFYRTRFGAGSRTRFFSILEKSAGPVRVWNPNLRRVNFAVGTPRNSELRGRVLYRTLIRSLIGRERSTFFRAHFEQGSDSSLEESDRIPVAPHLPDWIPITEHLDSSELQIRRLAIQEAFLANEGVPTTVRTYLEEAWYFVPVYLAWQLQQRGQYIAALDWLRTVYDYSAIGSLRKIYYGLVEEEDREFVYERGEEWLLDPLNPHKIAATRPNTYTRFTLLSLVRCFLDFANAEFTRDTSESVANARILYTTARELLESDDLRQSHEGCDQIIAEIEIEIGGDISLLPEWPRTWNEIKAVLKRIPARKRLTEVTSNLQAALHGSEPAQARLAQARQIVNRAVAEMAQPSTMEDLIGSQRRAVAGAHAALLANSAIVSAAGRIGTAARNDFAQAVSLISGVSKATLTETRVELPWLRLAMTDSFPAAHRDNGAGAGTMAGGFLSLDRNDPLTPPPLARAAPLQVLALSQKYGGFYLTAPSFTFCVPPNPILAALRMQVELNLYKIRTCRNIAGEERQLEPYAASTDIASGLPTIGTTGEIALPGTITLQPTQYRYAVLIERAKQLVSLAQQIEAAFLSTLEKRDAEYYQRLKAQQEIELAHAGVRLQDLRVREAQDNVTLSELQRDRAQIQLDYFDELLEEPISDLEAASLAALSLSLLVPDSVSVSAGFPGGVSVSASYSPSGKLQTTANILATLASYERRKQEWKFQRDLTRQDIRIGAQQVVIAEDRVRIAGQERAIAETQAEHAKETADFLANKFTNVELYDWMSGVLEGVYRFFLQQATALAQLSAAQLAFERQQVPPQYIQADYWESPLGLDAGTATDGSPPDRRGLTGSARLLQDIYQLDQYAFETDQRKQQLTKIISLAQLAPAEFHRFRKSGVLPFATLLELFDQDFPGHYLRLIKSVRVSVIALIPPTAGIKAVLATSGISRVVINNGGIFQMTEVRRLPETAAFTSPTNATGLFELTPQPQEMLLPFESMGIDAAWEFQMPKAANQFDFNTIADVLFTIEYTALNSFDYRQQVIQQLNRRVSADRPFSFRQEFADEWYDLNHPELVEPPGEPMIVEIETRREDFPPNLDQFTIQQVVLFFSRKEGAAFEVTANLTYTPEGSSDSFGGSATSIDGVISTRRGNASAWTPLIGSLPIGTWKLDLTANLSDGQPVADAIKNEEIEDILFVISYSGRTPEWPV